MQVGCSAMRLYRPDASPLRCFVFVSWCCSVSHDAHPMCCDVFAHAQHTFSSDASLRVALFTATGHIEHRRRRGTNMPPGGYLSCGVGLARSAQRVQHAWMQFSGRPLYASVGRVGGGGLIAFGPNRHQCAAMLGIVRGGRVNFRRAQCVCGSVPLLLSDA